MDLRWQKLRISSGAVRIDWPKKVAKLVNVAHALFSWMENCEILSDPVKKIDVAQSPPS